ncbi:MAG: hypothetical protein Q8M15_04505 [Bacteroidota bacterium]|nr:hypothetical protein [Bacteroidota bacterium]
MVKTQKAVRLFSVMNFRLLCLVTGIMIFLNPVFGSKFIYTHSLNEAQQHLAALRLTKALQMVKSENIAFPDNVACDYLLLYIEFYKAMIHHHENGLAVFEKLKNSTHERIKTLSDENPSKLYLLGSIHLQGALVKSVYNEYVSAALEFRSAYQFLNQNHKKFPAYLSTYKDLGALQALLGTFPDNYKWIVSLAGLSGSFEEGIKMLHNYILQASKEPLIEQQQAAIFYTLIQLNFGTDKSLAWNFYEHYSKDYSVNLMQNYVRAYVAGKCAHNDEAIATLHAKPATSDYEVIHYMDYLMGNYLLNKLDMEGAVWLKKYIIFNPTKYSVKESYQRLAWCSLMQKDTLKFMVYHNLMQKRGRAPGSEEKLVNADLAIGIYPNIQLIKARLLFDGGYYSKADGMLNSMNPFVLPGKFQRMEYEYRIARIAHEQKNWAKAIKYYGNTIDRAKKMDTYLAPNACLQLGLIYMNLHYNENAKVYLRKVSTYKNYDYKSSIEQKAKAALLQLE